MSKTSDRNAILMIAVVSELSDKYNFDLAEGIALASQITYKEALDIKNGK